MDWLPSLIKIAESFLTGDTALRAVVFSLLISWSTAQTLKFRPFIRNLSETEYRLMVRGLAFFAAYIPTLLLWPETDPLRIRLLAALTTALVSPFAYQLGSRMLVHFFPWLEPWLSGTPKQEDKP